jgi:hypothetical protein
VLAAGGVLGRAVPVRPACFRAAAGVYEAPCPTPFPRPRCSTG